MCGHNRGRNNWYSYKALLGRILHWPRNNRAQAEKYQSSLKLWNYNWGERQFIWLEGMAWFMETRLERGKNWRRFVTRNHNLISACVWLVFVKSRNLINLNASLNIFCYLSRMPICQKGCLLLFAILDFFLKKKKKGKI